MIFRPHLIEKILAGDKTVTRRKSPTKYVEGQSVTIQPGMAREGMAAAWIVSVRTEPLGAITDAEAVLEGFGDREEFLGYWDALYGDKGIDPTLLVDRIEFEVIQALLDLCPKCSGTGTVNHASTYENVAF